MFFIPQLNAFSVNGKREFHHFHPGSELYATVSQLYSAILNGAEVSHHVTRETIHFSGGRRTSVYRFEVRSQKELFTMAVQENPALLRFMLIEPFEVVPYAETMIHAETLFANA
jgi:hypothetical protein